ncbi:HIRAN domain-containing protein [Enterococcus cecorum]|uniref:HIRAN domain-containing protein n=1 Tax=Enterococcus cecorum TaxID=44008 RepID=UPI0031F58D11
MNTMQYQPSRHIMDFHLAGFAYCDGLDVIEELRLGQSVQLVREEGNPHDPDAVAVLYKNTKIGYVPAQYNGLFSTLLYYGHGYILEARIQMVNLETHPERQFRVVVKVTDARGDVGA